MRAGPSAPTVTHPPVGLSHPSGTTVACGRIRRYAPAVPTGTRDDDCLLCQAERITHWYHEDDLCWIADCTICATPMVVWRWHGVDPSPDDRAAMLARLSATADTIFDGHYYDDHMRNIPDHYHAHARRRIDWTRRP